MTGMVLKRVIPTLTVSAACALGAVPIASASAATDVAQASSSNWSGYVVGDDASDGSNGHFKTVTGSWVQPTATCSSGQTFSAFWVGLGGAGSSHKLEQDGTEANCTANGTATYTAWYELVPHAPVTVDLAVHPGDHMTATTTVDGDQTSFSIVNHTTGQSFERTIAFANPDTTSAEWIAEAPSACQGSINSCTPLPLSDFGTVSFTSAGATDTAGHTGSISDADWQTAALTLSPSSDQFANFQTGSTGAGASPSRLSGDGSSFSVAVQGDRTSAGSSAGSSGMGGMGGGGSIGSAGSGGGWGQSQPYAIAYPVGNGYYIVIPY
jgi:hypothetical protein